jgi:ankyrin repeat protein
MRSLWRFLHDTSHPQVRDTSPDEVAFHVMDKVTIRKMENALMKILLLGVEKEDQGDAAPPVRPVTANLAFAAFLEAPQSGDDAQAQPAPTAQSRDLNLGAMMPKPSAAEGGAGAGGYMAKSAEASRDLGAAGQRGGGQMTSSMTRASKAQFADPMSDLKQAFEPPKEKMKTFNLQQIRTKNGTILMNMLERLLETTEIDAKDMVEDKTLLEYACETGNIGLAKLCYRRGANLSAKTSKGDTPFNIVTRRQRYDLMEFLHTYGVKVNSFDLQGRTALHEAAANDDVDAVCRLLEWGADVNIRDNNKRTPIHIAAAEGKMKVSMLLLEVGADMNAKDCREYTAVAHAEANNHFALMDRLVLLGGKGHGLHAKESQTGLGRSGSVAKLAGELVVSAGMLKSSSLGRIGKVPVKGMTTGPLTKALTS